MILNETVKGKEVNILYVSGCNDGYYWDMNAVVEYDGEIYHICDAGSGSGYILSHSFVKKGDFARLYGEKQSEIDFDDEADSEYVINTVANLLTEFLNTGAKESLELNEDDDYNDHIFVDGVELVDFSLLKEKENEYECI